MRLSKANLAIAAIASADKTEPRIHRLHVEHDGSTVAAGHGARAIMAVEPVNPERAALFPQVEDREEAPGVDGVGIALDIARKAKALIPRVKRDALQYVQVTKCDGRMIELVATDGQQAWRAAGPPMRGRFPEWREAIGIAKRSGRTKVCVDARVLMQTLAAFLETCPDKANRNPVFLEVGDSHDPLLLRGRSYEMQQSVIALVKPLNTNGQWLEESEWERGVGAEMVREEPGERKPIARKVVTE